MIRATTISIKSQPMPTRFHIVNSPSFPVEKMSMQGAQRSIAPNSMAAIMQCHKTFRTIVPMILISLSLFIFSPHRINQYNYTFNNSLFQQKDIRLLKLSPF
jgi:hypothetical protein